MFEKVLIANRGEIAVRIARTLKRMNVPSVAVFSDADRDSAHVSAADQSVAIGAAAPSASYLDGDAILAAAKRLGVDAIIPGYGFLSENAAFAEACEAAGIAFVGPTPDQMRRFGLKHAAREIAEAAGVPLAPGTGLLTSLDEAVAAADRIGFPLMLKSTAGGGGIGLKRCNDRAELVDAFETVKRMGASFFNDAGVFLERFVDRARHVEVQIFGDGRGKVVALGERDCSIQRRNQKVIEETPAPRLPAKTRDALLAAAVALGEAVSYRSAGTVEFVYDAAADVFYFLEVNTRLQVEHPVTEMVTGLDLVEWMLRIAAGEHVALERPVLNGAAMEVRLYAEDPSRNFQPSPGVLTEVVFPGDARVDTWVATGTEVTPHYDPMLAKIIVHESNRADALRAMRRALAATRISGIATNLDYLQAILAAKPFGDGDVSTQYLATFDWQPATVEVVAPGTYTTVQDYPGRVGFWDIGVPPSGPMDDFAFRLANRIVGNDRSAAALECTIVGPTLKFHVDATIALTGAPTAATLDGVTITFNAPVSVRRGQTLVVGKAGRGCRTYLAIREGLDVPAYLGSKSTFALGQFGGHAGRPLRAQDQLKLVSGLSDAARTVANVPPPAFDAASAPATMIADYPDRWTIGCLIGPHSAPDFFTPAAVEDFFASDWSVHYNSNRLGVRLIGPKPTWTRTDGGEAGLHPSNIHDCEYAIGSVNFTGDMPVILTRDGPSLGGFVCPVTIAKGELWKVGQVKPGDTIRFVRMSFDAAAALELAQDAALESLACHDAASLGLSVPTPPPSRGPVPVADAILASLPASATTPQVVYRQAGDRYVLIEYGPNVLDLKFRFRIHALMEELKTHPIAGILELSPGVRSLQVHYDSRVVSQRKLIDGLLASEGRLPAVDDMRVDTRVIHLPMTFEDSATLDAVARYRQSVRDRAPWLPRNAEFMRRINGLDSVDEVRDILFKASYMVLGLGDVYLGAPCAVPVDPRHRLLTSKYNPARTYTAEGTVGIGGVYMCIYGMDSPGGYQLVGRTLPIWNKFLTNPVFVGGKPWLLRFFDQVRFYPVDEHELMTLREGFRSGRTELRISEEVFDLGEYNRFLVGIDDELRRFKQKQQAAFDVEIAHWKAEEDAVAAAGAAESDEPPVDDTAIDGHVVAADISGSVWKLLVDAGAVVAAGDPILIVEAMKMEFAVNAPVAGRISSLRCRQGSLVSAGEPLAVIEVA